MLVQMSRPMRSINSELWRELWSSWLSELDIKMRRRCSQLLMPWGLGLRRPGLAQVSGLRRRVDIIIFAFLWLSRPRSLFDFKFSTIAA